MGLNEPNSKPIFISLQLAVGSLQLKNLQLLSLRAIIYRLQTCRDY